MPPLARSRAVDAQARLRSVHVEIKVSCLSSKGQEADRATTILSLEDGSKKLQINKRLGGWAEGSGA